MDVWYQCEIPYPFVPQDVLDRADSVRASLPSKYCDPAIAANLFEECLDEFMLCDALGMNVVADGDAYSLRLDLAAVREMLQDYYEQDLWPIALDPAFGDLELVIADRSDTISADDRARLASAPPHVHVHHIDAGHWLHIDAPANVVELLVHKLPTSLR